jgi:hypothetical protein
MGHAPSGPRLLFTPPRTTSTQTHVAQENIEAGAGDVEADNEPAPPGTQVDTVGIPTAPAPSTPGATTPTVPTAPSLSTLAAPAVPGLPISQGKKFPSPKDSTITSIDRIRIFTFPCNKVVDTLNRVVCKSSWQTIAFALRSSSCFLSNLSKASLHLKRSMVPSQWCHQGGPSKKHIKVRMWAPRLHPPTPRCPSPPTCCTRQRLPPSTPPFRGRPWLVLERLIHECPVYSALPIPSTCR